MNDCTAYVTRTGYVMQPVTAGKDRDTTARTGISSLNGRGNLAARKDGQPAYLAQLVEHRFCTPKVIRSNRTVVSKVRPFSLMT